MVPSPSRPVTRPAVRLRPVPPLDPPFDDELAPEIWSAGSGTGQLTLDLALGQRSGSGPGDRGTATGTSPSPSCGTPATATDPDARQAARRFLAVCLEVLNGYRPLAHIRPLVAPADVEPVLAQLRTGMERLAQARHAGKRVPAQLRLVRVCQPRPGAVEAAAVLGDSRRTWALAFRLERRQGRWLSTAVRVL